MQRNHEAQKQVSTRHTSHPTGQGAGNRSQLDALDTWEALEESVLAMEFADDQVVHQVEARLAQEVRNLR